MRKGAYSEKFKALQEKKIDTLKKENKAVTKERKDREKQIIRETNKRRRYLALKRKALEDVEETKRQQVLAARKERQLEATNKFQRSQKLKNNKDVKDVESGAHILRDGIYNIRGHIVEIKNGMRVNGMPPSVNHGSMKGNSVTHDQKTAKTSFKNNINASKNAIYSGKSYLLHHLNDLVGGGQEKDFRNEAENGSEVGVRIEARNGTETDDNKEKRLEPEGSMNQESVLNENNMVNNDKAFELKVSSSDVSLSSSDSLELSNDANRQPTARRTPKSSLRNRGSSVNSDKEKRKVKFNSSIEFNDGFVWMLKDNEQKPSSLVEYKKNTTPVEDKANVRSEDEKESKLTTRISNYNNTSFAPALPRYDDYSYPDSVDLSSPSTTNFAKKDSVDHKLNSSRTEGTNNVVHNVSGVENLVDVSPTDSLELTNEETTELDLNDNKLEQRIISHSDALNTLPARDTELRKHAPGYSIATQETTKSIASFEEKLRVTQNQHGVLEQSHITTQAFAGPSSVYNHNTVYNGSSGGAKYSSRQNASETELGNDPRTNYGLQSETPQVFDYGSAGMDYRINQTPFQHAAKTQGYNAASYVSRDQQIQNQYESPKQPGEVKSYRQPDHHPVQNYHPRPAYSTVNVQPYHQTAFDRNSFLNIRGNSYFANRPSLEESSQNLRNYPTSSAQYINEHLQYQSSPQNAFGNNYSSTTAISSLHRNDEFDKSRYASLANNGNISNRDDFQTRTEATKRDMEGFRAMDAKREPETVRKGAKGDIAELGNEERLGRSDNNGKGYGSNRSDLSQGSTQQNVPFNAVSAIDLDQVLKKKNGVRNDVDDVGSDHEEDDEIISNVRKSMAELKFNSKWQPNVNTGKEETIDRSEEINDQVEIDRPTNKSKLIEQDVWVSDSDDIKKQSKIEVQQERKSNIPVPTLKSAGKTQNSAENAVIVQRKLSSGKAAQKPGLVPHPPPGPRGRLLPRKRPPSDGVRKRGSPMKVVNPSRVNLAQNEMASEEKGNFSKTRIGDNDYDNYYHSGNNNDKCDDYVNYANERDSRAFMRDATNQQRRIEERVDNLEQDENRIDKGLKVNTSSSDKYNKTPTDDEINELWYDVQSCLKTKPSHKASSDTVYISSPWRQQRTWSGSRNMNTRQNGSGFHRGQNASSNRLGSTLPLRSYGSHENLRRENSLDNLTGNVRIRGRSAMTLRNQKRKITPSVQAFSIRKSSTAPDPVSSNQTPVASKSRPSDVSESLASFLALETMCQQEALSPFHASAVLKASQNAYKGMKTGQRREDENPVFFNEYRRQEPSALSIEERKVMESLERLNSRLREKEVESNKLDAAAKWNSPLLTNGYSTATNQNITRRADSGTSHNSNYRSTRGNSQRQGKYKS